MVHARSLLTAGLMASATVAMAQEPICNPCVDGPEMFEHRRRQELRVADAIVLSEPIDLAFYEPARRTMAASMMRAINERCDTRAPETPESSQSERWYCGAE